MMASFIIKTRSLPWKKNFTSWREEKTTIFVKRNVTTNVLKNQHMIGLEFYSRITFSWQIIAPSGDDFIGSPIYTNFRGTINITSFIYHKDKQSNKHYIIIGYKDKLSNKLFFITDIGIRESHVFLDTIGN